MGNSLLEIQIIINSQWKESKRVKSFSCLEISLVSLMKGLFSWNCRGIVLQHLFKLSLFYWSFVTSEGPLRLRWVELLSYSDKFIWSHFYKHWTDTAHVEIHEFCVKWCFYKCRPKSCSAVSFIMPRQGCGIWIFQLKVFRLNLLRLMQMFEGVWAQFYTCSHSRCIVWGAEAHLSIHSEEDFSTTAQGKLCQCINNHRIN